METGPPGNRELLWYLAGVGTLSGLTIALLAALFVFHVPTFTLAFVENPAGAVRGEPVAALLVLGTVVSGLLLVVLVVVFGARYGPESTDRRN